jgi:hypothetical protein
MPDIDDDGQPRSRSPPRGVFEVDEDAALAEPEQAWATAATTASAS